MKLLGAEKVASMVEETERLSVELMAVIMAALWVLWMVYSTVEERVVKLAEKKGD